MKRKDKTQLHTMSIAELASQIRTLVEQIKKMKIDRFTKSNKNVHDITLLKRKLAIVHTIMQEKLKEEKVS